MVVEIDDKTSLEYAILENVQRTDLNPVEEAQGYGRLMEEFNYTQDTLSKIIGKSRSHIANTMRLMDLPEAIRDLLISRRITAGHGRALLAVNDPARVAQRIVDEGLSVRGVEEIAQADSTGRSRSLRQGDAQDRAGTRMRIPVRSNRRSGTRSACASPSITRARAASCGSATRPWSSSTACAAG